MNPQSAVVLVVVLTGLFGGQQLLAKDAPASDAQLLERLETAVKAKDKAAILDLYNWGRSSGMGENRREPGH